VADPGGLNTRARRDGRLLAARPCQHGGCRAAPQQQAASFPQQSTGWSPTLRLLRLTALVFASSPHNVTSPSQIDASRKFVRPGEARPRVFAIFLAASAGTFTPLFTAIFGRFWSASTKNLNNCRLGQTISQVTFSGQSLPAGPVPSSTQTTEKLMLACLVAALALAVVITTAVLWALQ
jgi:hypothetical protein